MLGLIQAIPFGVKVTLALFGSIVFLLYKFFTYHFDYWRKQGVKYIKPVPVFGSVADSFLLREHPFEFAQRCYRENEGQPFIGYIQGRTPTLMVLDPELIKQIFVKDFSHFVDHGFQISEEADPLQALNLFNLQGQKWKEMRHKLVPTFTSGKIKGMFPLMVESAEQFDGHLQEMAGRNEIFEAKDLLGCLFTDIIGSCIFGINCNTIKEPNNQFRVMGKRLIELNFIQAIKIVLVVFLPELTTRFKIGVLDSDVTEFFKKLTKDMMDQRKKSKTVRKDFLQLLMELKDKGSVAIDDDDEDKHLGKENVSQSNAPFKFDDTDLAAQATVFFLAGFETSSTVISFTLLELAVNPDVQRKAQLEIDEQLAQCGGKITYDTLKEMKYLEWIIQESMRKYPPVALHNRVCTKKYTIPDTNVTVDKGVIIAIPNHALQNDPKYFPNPDRFDPERFSGDDISHKSQYIYTPFGEGPRQCIGNRFAIVQSKLALLTFLRRYTISTCEKTQFPVKFDAKQFILTSKNGIWLKIQKRE